MPKVVVMLADGFEEVEALSIIDVLRRAEIETVVAGLHKEPVSSARGVLVMTDAEIGLIKAADFDMIVLPGGQPGSNNLNADLRVKELVREFFRKGKLVGAICAAPIVLANADILRGKRATSYPTYKHQLGEVLYEEKSVVADGNILTSRGPGTALLFSLAIVERLVGRDTAEKIREAMLVPKPEN